MITVKWKTSEQTEKKELTKKEKIKLGLIRPYSLTADIMIADDIEKGLSVETMAKIYSRDPDDLKKHIEEIKGKVKSCWLEGDENNFKEFYAAIWKQAVDDDFIHKKIRLFYETTEKLFPYLLKYKREDRKSISRTRNIIERESAYDIAKFEELERELDKAKPILLTYVREKVLRESRIWPQNRPGVKDKEYELKYKEIRNSIINNLVKPKIKGECI